MSTLKSKAGGANILGDFMKSKGKDSTLPSAFSGEDKQVKKSKTKTLKTIKIPPADPEEKQNRKNIELSNK